MKKKEDDFFYRIIDVNFNRAREGLRVCEDIARYIIKSERLTRSVRSVRHELTGALLRTRSRDLLRSRDSLTDVGRGFTRSRRAPKDYTDVFAANIERAKESVRVLEEFFKLNDAALAKRLMKARYRIYEIEKVSIKKLRAICSDR